MASSVPPVKGVAFTFDFALESQADNDIFKTTPTLAAGDITVSKDGGDFANIGTLPTQIQTTGVLPIALTADEMNADRVTLRFHDADGDEWRDALVTIHTCGQTLDAIEALVDDIGIAGAGLTALGDTRLANLDATVSSRSSHSAADVWSVATRTLTNFGTLVADVWAYGTRTLTSLSALVASIAAAVWTYATRTLTQSAAAVTAVVTGSDITITRGDTTSISLTDLGAITGYTQVWFAVKEAPDSQADTASLIYVTQTGGLVYLNGAAVALPYLSSDASIVVDDAATGDITITLKAALTAALTARGGYQYEVQWKSAAGAIATLTQGTFNVSADVVRAVS